MRRACVGSFQSSSDLQAACVDAGVGALGILMEALLAFADCVKQRKAMLEASSRGRSLDCLKVFCEIIFLKIRASWINFVGSVWPYLAQAIRG